MKHLIIALALALSGCAAPALKGESSISGWSVKCSADKALAQSQCHMAKFDDGVPFILRYRITSEGVSGPVVEPGYNTFPGRDPTVRVDQHMPVSDMRSAKLIDQMRTGTTAVATYHVWPGGRRTMSVDLAGFEAALADLQRQVASARSGPL